MLEKGRNGNGENAETWKEGSRREERKDKRERKGRTMVRGKTRNIAAEKGKGRRGRC